MQGRSDALEAELGAAQAEAAAAATQAALQIELLQAQTRAMQEELEAMAQRSQEMAAQVSQLNQGLESYQNRVSELRAHQAGLGRRLAAKEASLQTAGQRLGRAELYAAGLRATLVRAGQDQAAIRADLDASRAGLAEAEAEMRRLLGSRSFRVTAPLRRLMALFGRGEGS